jgi:hypothetical protein
MKWVFFVVGALAVTTVAAAGDVVISATDNFRGVIGVTNAKCERTPEALVFTDILYDMQISCKTKAVRPYEVEALEFRYRATGEVKRKTGGELFYSSLGSSFSDGRKWSIPPLIRDGEWHVMTVSTNAIVDPADWMSSGVMNKFRFDPTNAEGGKLEISEIRFRMRRGSVVKANAVTEKFNGEDAWPEITPESFKTDTVKGAKITAVKVEFRGGTSVPREQTAGQKVCLRYDYRGEVPEMAFMPTAISIVTADGSLKWSEWISIPLAQAVKRVRDDVWTLEFDYELPLYLGSFDGFVRCESPHLQASAGKDPVARLAIRRIKVDPEWAEPIRSEVQNVGGSPCFAVNGKPVYALWGTISYGRRQDRPSRHSSAPLNFVTVWTRHLEWWPGRDDFDPTDLDRLAEQHRRQFPDAYFMWDISIYPPPDWSDANPDEMTLDEQLQVNSDGGRVNFSFASKKAYDDMERVMRKVIDHLENSPYANRIVGYRINSGHTVEWLGWDPSRKSTILDFSPVAQQGFEAFAKKHYPWITDFSVPTLAERRELDADGGILWDQRKHARPVAYHDYFSTVVADGAIRMCRSAKKMVGGRKLIGTYYAYVMTLNGGGCNQMRAHYATKHFLDAGAVDFLMSPHNYSHASRQPGSQICDMKPFRTIQNHGVVSVIEDDTRTHNVIPVGYSQTLTEEMTVMMMRRNMGVSICRNQPFYSFAITSGVEFDFPQFADDAAALAKAGAHAVAAGVKRNAEIAVVVSEEAIKSTPMYSGNTEYYVGKSMQTYDRTGKVTRHERVGGTKNSSWQYVNAYSEYACIGAAVDFVLAEDLADHPGDYKLYIMQSCTKLTPSLVKAAKKLRDRDCTILWTYAPGYTSNDGNSLANMKTLTGMDFELCTDVTEPGVTLEDGAKVGSLTYPKEHMPLAPIFAAANPDKVLGSYSNGAAGLAQSRTGKAQTIFSGSYFMEGPLLHTLAKAAGVHVFSDSLDVFEANERFLSFHARNAGQKTIRLPRKTTVIDVFNREVVAKGVDEFSFDAPLHSSWLFYFADDAEELLRGL